MRTAAAIVERAEKLMRKAMGGNDASHDAWHVLRVRDLALSIAREEGLSSSPDSMLVVSLLCTAARSYFRCIEVYFCCDFLSSVSWRMYTLSSANAIAE
ncbi:hypothetical protein SAY87_025898 [Trapa incisa]|uniref:Uncharacterized protein n=1 Tax=Trapa incisa TaxID=236973 RepID=A0AAN7GIH8_9MYRT|nr:hypothetical protein SAY87_025898 [Trapa incisa]